MLTTTLKRLLALVDPVPMPLGHAYASRHPEPSDAWWLWLSGMPAARQEISGASERDCVRGACAR